MILQSVLGKTDIFGKISGDITLIVILIAVSVGFGLLIGRFRLVNVLINIYIAFAFVTVLPQDILDISKNSSALIFLSILVALTLVSDYLFDIHISNSSSGFFWRLFVMSFLLTSLTFSMLVSMLEKKLVMKYISIDAFGYFAAPYASFFWMAAPLLFLFFLNKRQK